MNDQHVSNANSIINIFSSEISRQTAGSPRVCRFTERILYNGYTVKIFDTSSFFKTKVMQFTSLSEFKEYRMHIENNNIMYSNGSSTSNLSNILRKFKHYFLLDVFSPGIFHGILLLFKNKSSKCYATSPSPGNIFLAYLSNIFFESKTMCDMRDEWAFHRHIYFHKKFRAFIEENFLKSSLLVTTVSKTIKERYQQNYNLTNIETVYNVSDKLKFSKKNNTKSVAIVDEIRFAYFGTMPNGYYDEELFFAFLEVAEKYNYLSKFTFDFIGFSGKIKLKILSSKYKSHFNFLPAVSHNESLNLMSNYDCLLFFAYNAEDNGGIVSTKLFEYIGSGSKVLPFSVRQGSDIDYILQCCCLDSYYFQKKEDFIDLFEKNDFLQHIAWLKNQECLDEMLNMQNKQIDEFLLL